MICSKNVIFMKNRFSVSPKIKQLFLVRDVQIRLILLDYFGAYMDYFDSREILSNHILPQLLLGIKDTNDQLVAATLRCLADLVPVLGSSVVIGKLFRPNKAFQIVIQILISISIYSVNSLGSNRSRIFADGKPNSPFTNLKWTEGRSITPIMNGAGIMNGAVSGSPMPTDSAGDVISDIDFVSIVNSHATIVNTLNDKEAIMPERLSPDGADEGDELQITNEQTTEFEDDAWSDWETEKQPDELQQSIEKSNDHVSVSSDAMESKDETSSIATPGYQRNISISSSNSTATNNNQNNDSLVKDIKDIEIKPVKNQLYNEIDDLFKDMEPVIDIPNSITSLLNSPQMIDTNCTNKDSPQKSAAQIESKIDQNRFAIAVTADDEDNFDDAAWGDEANDWDN